MLDAAIKVYRSRPRQMVLATAVVIGPAIVLQTLVQLSSGDPQALTATDPATGLPTVELGTRLRLPGRAADLDGDPAGGQQPGPGRHHPHLPRRLPGRRDRLAGVAAVRARRFWPLLAVLVISGAGIVLGFLLCIAPAIWLQGIWAVAVPALLVEDRGALDSLRRSSQLVKGRFWPVVGAILLGSLLASLLQGVLVAPVLVLQLAGTSFLVTSILLTGAVQLVGVALTTPYVAALTAVVYVDLRVRKEAFDLELLAGGVGVEPPSVDGPCPDAPTPSVPTPPAGGWGSPAGAGGWTRVPAGAPIAGG